MGILTLLLCAGNLGLPVLMDPTRCSIYYAYLLVAVLTLLGDGILYLIFMPRILRVIRNAAAVRTDSDHCSRSMLHQGSDQNAGFGVRLCIKWSIDLSDEYYQGK